MQQKQLEITRSLNIEELRNFGQVEGPCLTVYFSLQPAPNTSRYDFQRLKAAVRQADARLRESWPDLAESTRRELISSLQEVEAASGEWGGEGGSLVILRSPQVFRAFEVRQELDETVVVGDFFHIFPMLRHLQMAEQVFYVLALSQKRVRLLRCTRTSAQEVSLPQGVPTSLEEWLNTRMPNAAPEHGAAWEAESGSTAGSFTSTTDVDNKDQHLANFYRVVNRGVVEVLRGQRNPLVLCGVEYERAIYQQINDYEHLWRTGVQGSPESLKGGEMHARALEAVQEFFAQPAQKALQIWERSAGAGRAASSFPDIVKAAFEGRIDSLFARENAQTMGVFDRETMQMRVQGRQEDLVNAAALQTLAFGGNVFILRPEDMPTDGQMAALLRY